MSKNTCNMKLYWVVSVWPKWQIVIPKELRDKLNIETGTTMALILKDDKYIWLVKNEDMWEILAYIKSEKK